MNFSVFVLVLLTTILDVVYSDESTRDGYSFLELYPDFVGIKEEINMIKKRVSLKPNYFQNYRVKADHNKDAVQLSRSECWIKCIETDGCTSASFQSEVGTCALSQVTYVSYDVLERAVGWELFTSHTPVGVFDMKSRAISYSDGDTYCASIGLSMARMEDLIAAHKLGYQNCDCAWSFFGYPYLINPSITPGTYAGCFKSLGVIKCAENESGSVYCKPNPFGIINVSKTKEQNMMSIADARSACKTYETSLATMEDMRNAFNMGLNSCTCGWVDNNIPYFISQHSDNRCHMSVGVIPCEWSKSNSAWCKAI